jgi:hypothetical protein
MADAFSTDLRPLPPTITVDEVGCWRFCPSCGQQLLVADSNMEDEESPIFEYTDPRCSGCERPWAACPCAPWAEEKEESMAEPKLLENRACHPCANHPVRPQVHEYSWRSPAFWVECVLCERNIAGDTPEDAVQKWNVANPPGDVQDEMPSTTLVSHAEAVEQIRWLKQQALTPDTLALAHALMEHASQILADEKAVSAPLARQLATGVVQYFGLA